MPALNLRLPDEMHALAKIEAARLGVSINALFCFALDAYLSRIGNIQSAPLAAPAAPLAAPAAPLAAPALSRQQRRLLERRKGSR